MMLGGLLTVFTFVTCWRPMARGVTTQFFAARFGQNPLKSSPLAD